jgi:hypothetical protein
MDPKEILRQVIEDNTEEAEQLDEFRPRFFHRLEDQLEFLDRLADQIIEQYAPTLQELKIDLMDEELEQHLLWINDPEQSITGEIATHSTKKSMRAAYAYDKLHPFIKEAKKDMKSKAENDKDSFEKAKDSFKKAMDLQWLQMAYLIHAFVPRWLTDGFDTEEDTGWLLFIGFVHGRLHAGSVDRSPFKHVALTDYLHRRRARDHRMKRRVKDPEKEQRGDAPKELIARVQEAGKAIHKQKKGSWRRYKIATHLFNGNEKKYEELGQEIRKYVSSQQAVYNWLKQVIPAE